MTNDKLLEDLKAVLAERSGGVCEHHEAFAQSMKTMQADIKEIKDCLLGNGKPGIKSELTTHLAQHKTFGGLTKYVIASVIVPIIAIVISLYAIKMSSDKNSERLKVLIERNVVEISEKVE